MKRIANIKDLGINDIPLAGGKAANLGELTSAGFDVPQGFVLTTSAYDYFLQHNGLKSILSTFIAGLDSFIGFCLTGSILFDQTGLR